MFIEFWQLGLDSVREGSLAEQVEGHIKAFRNAKIFE